MAPYPVHVDHALYLHLLAQQFVQVVWTVMIPLPLHGVVRNIHLREYILVEIVLTHKAFRYIAEEYS